MSNKEIIVMATILSTAGIAAIIVMIALDVMTIKAVGTEKLE